MRAVRDRCVWTQQIDHRALVPYLVEESAELIDAVEDGSRAELREELGDLLWQVLFHAEIASRDPDEPFDIDDVARGLTEKMVRRHPHVFGDAVANTPEEVLVHWNAAKAAEKHTRTSVLDGVSERMPSLALAQKLARQGAPRSGVAARSDRPSVARPAAPRPSSATRCCAGRDRPRERLGRRARAPRAPAAGARHPRRRAVRRRIRRRTSCGRPGRAPSLDDSAGRRGGEPTWKNRPVASVNPPRGMRDFLPAEKARRERVLAVIRERYRAHGFDEIETPVMEEYSRLHAGIGGDNEKLAYNVLKRGLDADAIRGAADDPAALTDLGLRYDLTVPLARFYASHRGELPTVFRSIQIAPVWRAERPQKGRYRQFVQCDIDIIGDASSRAEAELVVATLDTVDALGLEGATVRINDRRALDWMLDGFGFTADERPGVLITIDKLDKIGPDGRRRRAARARRHADGRRRARGVPDAPDDAWSTTRTASGRSASSCPQGAPDEIVAHLVGIGEAVAAARARRLGDRRGLSRHPARVRPVPRARHGLLHRHDLRARPPVRRLLARRRRPLRRHDRPLPRPGRAGRRLLDRLRAHRRPRRGGGRMPRPRRSCWCTTATCRSGELLALKAALVAEGSRVRLEQRTKNLKALLERAASDGYTAFATVGAGRLARVAGDQAARAEPQAHRAVGDAGEHDDDARRRRSATAA